VRSSLVAVALLAFASVASAQERSAQEYLRGSRLVPPQANCTIATPGDREWFVIPGHGGQTYACKSAAAPEVYFFTVFNHLDPRDPRESIDFDAGRQFVVTLGGFAALDGRGELQNVKSDHVVLSRPGTWFSFSFDSVGRDGTAHTFGYMTEAPDADRYRRVRYVMSTVTKAAEAPPAFIDFALSLEIVEKREPLREDPERERMQHLDEYMIREQTKQIGWLGVGAGLAVAVLLLVVVGLWLRKRRR
jgi:hypothetical protein